MKIGILTTYFADYGSFCHATALYKYLEDNGFDCELINECVRYNVSKRLFLGHCLLTFVPNILTKKIVTKNVMLNNYYHIANDLRRFKVSESFNEISDISEKYDYIIIGADELWSLTNDNIKYIPAYFGIGIKCPIITYATSGITLRDINKNLTDEIKNSLAKIESISVRDTVTQKWVSEVVNRKIPITLDPALLYPYYVVSEKVEKEDYILVYGEHFSEAQINSIIIFSAMQNKRLVSVVWKHNWCNDNMPICSCYDLQAYFKRASYCVTSTFHGTIFSIVNHIPFTAFISQLRGAKVVCLLQQLGLEHRIYEKNPERCFDECINYSEVEEKLEIMRRESKRYIKTSLDNEK